jgi:hypothetical protein
MTPGHWAAWHAAYDDPDSSISRRLAHVQLRIRQALDGADAGPIRVISMCAGEGRDLLEVLPEHERRDDVSARLVELDPGLAGRASAKATDAGLSGVEVVVGDASSTSAYEGAVPADLVLACGIFGNVSVADVRRTVGELAHLCARGATVIWTRHRLPPDLTDSIRSWFGTGGFEELGFDTESGYSFAVGTHRLVAEPGRFRPGQTMFRFAGDGADSRF